MRRAPLHGLAMIALPVLTIGMFIGVPIVFAVAYSFGHTGGLNSGVAEIALHQHVGDGWGTLGAYREVFSNDQTLRNLRVTLIVTVVAVVVVLVLAWAIALYLKLSNSWLAKALAALSVVPLFIPVVIASYAIREFYDADGPFRSILHHLGWSDPPNLYNTTAAVTIGEIWVSIPFAVLMVSSGLAAVPNALIEAARDCGASRTRTVFSVLVPMTSLPTIIATTFTAITIVGSFTVPYLTGPTTPNMLGVAMQQYFGAFSQPQQAQVLAMIVFAIAAVIGSLYVRANLRAAKRSGAV